MIWRNQELPSRAVSEPLQSFELAGSSRSSGFGKETLDDQVERRAATDVAKQQVGYRRVRSNAVRPDRVRCRAGACYCLTISTEISTAGIVPLFSSQCVVFLSSGQPTPGP